VGVSGPKLKPTSYRVFFLQSTVSELTAVTFPLVQVNTAKTYTIVQVSKQKFPTFTAYVEGVPPLPTPLPSPPRDYHHLLGENVCN